MMSWNLQWLRSEVRGRYVDPDTILAYITSVQDTNAIFKYHFTGARDTLKRLELPERGITVSVFERALEGSKQQDTDLLAIRANILACIQALRNGYDHFAQLCNALLIDPPIDESKVTLYQVRQRLPSGELKDLLFAVATSPWFKYIHDYTNTSKHRALVSQSLHLNFEDGIAGVRTEAFSHDGQDYPAYLVPDLLKGILELKNQIVPLGVALNAAVAARNC